MTPVGPLLLSIDIPILFDHLAHCLEEVVKTHSHHIPSRRFDNLLRINTRGTIDRAVHTGGTTKHCLCHFFGGGKFSFQHLFEKDDLSVGIGDGPLCQVEDRANRPAEAAPGALSDRFATFFIELELSGHLASGCLKKYKMSKLKVQRKFKSQMSKKNIKWGHRKE